MKTTDVEKVVTKLKYIDARKGKKVKHKIFKFFFNDKYITMTSISHGAKELKPKTSFSILKQMFLSQDEFSTAVKCTYNYPDYIKKLESLNLI